MIPWLSRKRIFKWSLERPLGKQEGKAYLWSGFSGLWRGIEPHWHLSVMKPWQIFQDFLISYMLKVQTTMQCQNYLKGGLKMCAEGSVNTESKSIPGCNSFFSGDFLEFYRHDVSSISVKLSSKGWCHLLYSKTTVYYLPIHNYVP